MCTEERDWIVDVLYDVQKMLKSNDLIESADTLESTILLSLLEIANLEVLESRNVQDSNVVTFSRYRTGQI